MATEDDGTRALLERWVPARLRALQAYTVQDARGLVKLDAMENPYPWPAELLDDWLAALRALELNRYPSAHAPELKAALAQRLGVPAGAGLLLGNGSDEIIQLLAMLVAAPGRCILAPEPTFVMYRQLAVMLDMDFEGVALRADFELDLPAMLAAIERRQPALVFLAYPNNPTANLFDAGAVRAVLDAAPGLVVVDEAYAPFADASFLDEVGKRPNLAVMRTLSKAGFAGLRLGLLAAPPAWCEALDKLRLPYNINTLTQASTLFALRHFEAFDAQVADIRLRRSELRQALSAHADIEVLPSAANFLLLRLPGGRAPTVFAGLRARGVLVKNLHGAGPGLHDCLRVTVGSAADNAALLSALIGAMGD